MIYEITFKRQKEVEANSFEEALEKAKDFCMTPTSILDEQTGNSVAVEECKQCGELFITSDLVTAKYCPECMEYFNKLAKQQFEESLKNKQEAGK